MGIHPIALKPSDRSSLQTFMVVAEKENSPVLCQILSTVDQSSFGGPKNQVKTFHPLLIFSIARSLRMLIYTHNEILGCYPFYFTGSWALSST